MPAFFAMVRRREEDVVRTRKRSGDPRKSKRNDLPAPKRNAPTAPEKSTPFRFSDKAARKERKKERKIATATVFALDNSEGFGYNREERGHSFLRSGAVMVSTGTLRYDKRSGQEDPVKPSDLNNKRQQQSCCSGVSRVAAFSCRPYRRRGLRLRPCVK